MYAAFHIILGFPSVAWDLRSTIPASCSPVPTSSVPPPKFHVPGSLFPHSWSPALIDHFPPFSTISPIFLVQLWPTFHPSSFQPQFPTLTPRPVFLQWGPSTFSTPSPQFQSFTAGCFSPPVYANSTNKGQFPSSSLLGIQEVIDTEHKSPWLYQEAPRRELPEISHSVPAAIDRPEHKSPQTETSKTSVATLKSICQVCANCDFPRIYNLAESGYFSQKPELSCTTFFCSCILEREPQPGHD